jgi:imidazolonepropionase-like amidohydrolase
LSKILIKGGTVIDGTGRDPVEDYNILISGNKIDTVGFDGSVSNATTTIDAAGLTVLPGLIDSHVHLSHVPGNRFTALPSSHSLAAYVAAKKCLNMGFTTVRDCGSYQDSTLALRNSINAGWLDGPRVQVGGTITATMGHFDEGWPVTLPRPHEKYVADGVDEIRKAVRERVREGVDFIKTSTSDSWSLTRSRSWWRNYTLNELEVMVDEAHSFGLKVSAHAYDAEPSVKNAVLAGVDNIDHGIYLDENVVQLMKERGTSLSPTLVTIKLMYEKGSTHPLKIPDYEERAKETWELHQKSVQMAHDAGVKVGLSTDANMGYDLMGNNAWELEILVDLGMTEMEALMAATKVNAEIMDLDKDIGTLESGKFADLILVDGDPLKDITILNDESRIKLVMLDGDIVVDRR